MKKEKENEQSNMIIKMSFKQHIKKEKKKNSIFASSSCIVKQADMIFHTHFVFLNNISNISIMQV